MRRGVSPKLNSLLLMTYEPKFESEGRSSIWKRNSRQEVTSFSQKLCLLLYLLLLHFKLNCKCEESRKKSRKYKKNEPPSNLVRDKPEVGTSKEPHNGAFLFLFNFRLLLVVKVSCGAGRETATTLEALKVEVVDDDGHVVDEN